MTTTTLTNIADELANLGSSLRDITVRVRSNPWASGSGVIWQPSPLFPGSLIITNAHVAISSRATVEVADGRSFAAVRTKIDPELDLAALTITATDLPTATIGNAEALRVGELVVAVGNPFADKGAVTTGIIHTMQARAVLADIRLFPGNSGGPLANCLGYVVGINTMIVNGLGVAIPSSTVERFLRGDSRPQLGIRVQPVVVNKHTLGLLVLSVQSDSAAASAGIMSGDVITGVAGQMFTSSKDLHTHLHHAKDEALPIQILRHGRQLLCHVVLSSNKNPAGTK